MINGVYIYIYTHRDCSNYIHNCTLYFRETFQHNFCQLILQKGGILDLRR